MAYIRNRKPKTPEERRDRIIEKINSFAEAMSEFGGNTQEIADDLAEKFQVELSHLNNTNESTRESE
jgi:hypothetical protein